MRLEEAKRILLFLQKQLDDGVKMRAEYDDSGVDDEISIAISEVLSELFAMQNLLDEKNEEIEQLKKENTSIKARLETLQELSEEEQK